MEEQRGRQDDWTAPPCQQLKWCGLATSATAAEKIWELSSYLSHGERRWFLLLMVPQKSWGVVGIHSNMACMLYLYQNNISIASAVLNVNLPYVDCQNLNNRENLPFCDLLSLEWSHTLYTERRETDNSSWRLLLFFFFFITFSAHVLSAIHLPFPFLSFIWRVDLNSWLSAAQFKPLLTVPSLSHYSWRLHMCL